MKEQQLTSIIQQFVKDQRIYCAETIYQTDRVMENACQLIEQLCEIVGYLTDDED